MNVPNSALDHATALFEYREQATGRALPQDPDWPRVISDSFKSAVAGERGDTDQQQCVFQGIRLALWESGMVRAPWSKAFLPQAQPRAAWYRRWWGATAAWCRRILKRINDSL